MKIKYVPQEKTKKKEVFFNFKDVQTIPVKWAKRVNINIYTKTPIEIHKLDLKKRNNF